MRDRLERNRHSPRYRISCTLCCKAWTALISKHHSEVHRERVRFRLEAERRNAVWCPAETCNIVEGKALSVCKAGYRVRNEAFMKCGGFEYLQRANTTSSVMGSGLSLADKKPPRN